MTSVTAVDRERLLQYFLDLVRIESPSFGEHHLASRLEADLAGLGLLVTNDHSGPNQTGNLTARFPGEGGVPIALSAHMDTVEPCRGVKPRVVDGIIRSDGTTILGADDKGGLAAIIEAIRIVQEQGIRHGPIELLLTYGEERGHAGAKTLDLAGLQSRIVMVLDGIGPPGTVISEAPSYDSFKALFHGVASHAGLAPEKGLSAIVVAAEAVRRMKLGRIDEETSANVGLISGGTGRNVVPDRVEIVGEARSRNNDKLVRLTGSLREAMEGAARDFGATADVTVVREYSGYRLAEDEPGVALAMRAARKMGLATELASMGGGSDANTFNERGLPSVALGIGMNLPHAVEESIAIDDLVRSTEYLIAVIREAAEAQ